MKRFNPNIAINVDVTNPGQFFACCGLFELAHRMPGWQPVEGCFDKDGRFFRIAANAPMARTEDVLASLRDCLINQEEHNERKTLNGEKKDRGRLSKRKTDKLTMEEQRLLDGLKAEHEPISELPPLKERRLNELDGKARAGSIELGAPFHLMLDWWGPNDDGAVLKTWAGMQEPRKIVRAAQRTLAVKELGPLDTCFDYGCVMRLSEEYQDGKASKDTSVEPFYFDSRRFAHALDTGFSLDVQKAQTVAHPVVELLALIGLQRFRNGKGRKKGYFQYRLWTTPLCAPVAAAVVCGAIMASPAYEFQLLFRDGKKRYKAFSFATPIGGNR